MCLFSFSYDMKYHVNGYNFHLLTELWYILVNGYDVLSACYVIVDSSGKCSTLSLDPAKLPEYTLQNDSRMFFQSYTHTQKRTET